MDENRKLLGNFEICWWKFYWKIEFLFYFYFYFIFNFIFGKSFTKNRDFGNNAIFYNIFSVSGGGFPPFPWLRPWRERQERHFSIVRGAPHPDPLRSRPPKVFHPNLKHGGAAAIANLLSICLEISISFWNHVSAAAFGLLIE